MITDKEREDAKIICRAIKIPIELSIGGLKIVTTVSTGEILAKLNSKEFNEHVRLLEKSKEYAESYNRQKRDTHPLKEGKTRGDVKPFTYSKKPNKPSKGQK